MTLGPLRRFATLLLVALPLAGISSFEALFAPKSELWERWQAHDPGATAVVDHGAWQGLLQAYLRPGADGLNRFDYGAVGPTGRAALEGYVAHLAAQPIDRLSKTEQLAFWINLYNALTVRVVLEHYPVDSIRDIDISPGLFADGPWDKALVTVAGEELSLNDIEHRILRPIWRDRRIHYALNCASVGCPNLLAEAFTGANAEALLDAAARAYVNGPRGLRLVKGKVIVSSIYVWFKEDFGRSDAAILAHLARFAEPDLAAKLAGVTKLDDHAYDWTLNDAAGSGS